MRLKQNKKIKNNILIIIFATDRYYTGKCIDYNRRRRRLFSVFYPTETGLPPQHLTGGNLRNRRRNAGL